MLFAGVRFALTTDRGRERKNIASEAAREDRDQMMRFKIRLAGGELDESVPDPEADEEFNDRARRAMAALKRR